jgi:hypothetical protein
MADADGARGPGPTNPLGDAAQGVEHLQKAAKELIRAVRSLLDAAEGLVDDPTIVQSVAGTLTDLAGAASTWLRTSPPADDDGGSGDGKVQRIQLS